MIVRFANTQQEWDEWVAASETPRSSGAFLQSWIWGEFQEAVGRRVARLVVEDHGKTIALAQMIRMTGSLRTFYWYIPRGPRLVEQDTKRSDVIAELLQYIRDARDMRGALFVRYDPEEQWTHALEQLGPMMQPWATRTLDLTLSEDALLAAMKPKSRYNIRVAERHKVKVSKHNSARALKHFWELAHETAKRQQIAFHPHSYYKKMQEVYEKSDDFVISEAEYDHKVIASGLFLRFHKTVTYLHGASSHEYKNVMAPYLLHWQAIQDAKHRGAHVYDFWGVAATPAQEKSWQGITRFKEGFGGTRLDFAHTHEIPLRKNVYAMYRLIKRP
ncbi:MAG: peptidoglycan bridge formation glycyltransferase FemA/FemB family protein [Candidatus Kerfeldbacteria bacterium]|nr:peptidoglycan bridge formation glycyltransferase FemA/FemB family protein [Candidatus Kerfeldbacteria bacterium]